MKITTKLCCGIAFISMSATANAHEKIHFHESDSKFNIDYTYSETGMTGNRDGSHKISTDDILAQGYMMAPKEMRSRTHTISANYQFMPAFGLGVVVPYHLKRMTHTDGMMMDEDMKSEGLGDVKIIAHSEIAKGFSAHYGVSLPTGSTKEKYHGEKLEYMMQNGSGTYDPILKLSYETAPTDWQFGADAGTILRFGKNSQGYRLGNEYDASIWARRNINPNLSITAGLEGSKWENIKGEDDDLDPMMNPANDPNKHGGEKIDFVVGFDAGLFPQTVEGVKLGAELGIPIYQRLDGPQLESDYHLMVRLRKEF